MTKPKNANDQLSPEEAYEHAALALASYRLLLEEIPADDGDITVSQGFDRATIRKMEERLKKNRSTKHIMRTVSAIGKAALILIAAINLCVAVAFAASEDVRSTVFHFFISVFETHTDIGMSPKEIDSIPEAYKGNYYPTFLPDVGLDLLTASRRLIEWETPDQEVFVHFEVCDASEAVSLDTEGYDYHKAYDQNWHEYSIFSDNRTGSGTEWYHMVWREENQFLIVSTYGLTEQTAFQIAESVYPMDSLRE